MGFDYEPLMCCGKPSSQVTTLTMIFTVVEIVVSVMWVVIAICQFADVDIFDDMYAQGSMNNLNQPAAVNFVLFLVLIVCCVLTVVGLKRSSALWLVPHMFWGVMIILMMFTEFILCIVSMKQYETTTLGVFMLIICLILFIFETYAVYLWYKCFRWLYGYSGGLIYAGDGESPRTHGYGNNRAKGKGVDASVGDDTSMAQRDSPGSSARPLTSLTMKDIAI